ncbi:MAG: tyrosine-type recombinase/integrase [Aggregatilineales bacterium]
MPRKNAETIFLTEELPYHWRTQFLRWLTSHLSSGTRKVYVSGWRNFLAFIQKDVADIRKGDVDHYRAYLKNDAVSTRTKKALSGTTINLYLAALSSFYKYALEQEWLLLNPVDGVVRMPVSPYEKARWLQGDDDVRLLSQPDRETIQGKRDYALLLLFLTTAMRLNEVVQLRIGSLRQVGERTALSYRKKGGEDVQKILAPIAVKAIETYLTTRDNLTPEAPLFVASTRGLQSARNLQKHTDTDMNPEVFEQRAPLSGRSIEKLIATCAKRAFGDNHGITVHSLRHTAAMNALESGRTITEISDLLKHRNTRVTAIYLHRMEGAGDKVSEMLASRYEE